MVEKIDLIASKAMTYATRRLVADDVFQASRRDARLLVAIGKAKFVDPAEEAPVKPKQPAPKARPGRSPAKPKAS